ncbi:MAG: hypothetical protein ACFFD5_05660 [Candidatus Thorarchaeota archaeon]
MNYVGIKENQIFKWKLDISEPSFTHYNDDATQYINYIFGNDEEGYKIVINNISEEQIIDGFKFVVVDFKYYNTSDFNSKNWNLINSHNTSIIYNFDYNNYSLNDFLSTPFFVPTKVDWDNLSTKFTSEAASIPSLENYNIQSRVNGISIELDYNDTYKIHIILDYNINGILKTLKLYYNEFISFNLIFAISIPGTPISLIFMTIILAVIGSVLMIKRKLNKII